MLIGPLPLSVRKVAVERDGVALAWFDKLTTNGNGGDSLPASVRGELVETREHDAGVLRQGQDERYRTRFSSKRRSW